MEKTTELSNPLSNDKYRDLVQQELLDIIGICESTSDQYDTVAEAMLWVLSKCKAPVIYGMNTEHLVRTGLRRTYVSPNVIIEQYLHFW